MDSSSPVPPAPAPDSNPQPATEPVGLPLAVEASPSSSVEAVSEPTPSAPPALPPPLPADSPAPREPARITFHGEANEYFRIWIVNTLLTLLTAGVFLAWAKVRKRRYLRGNTELLGHRFDYRADPKGLLIGNVIVFIFFIAYALVGRLYLQVQFLVIALAIVLLPWVVVRSLSFNANNTAYRGMRFRFHHSLLGAAGIYIFKLLLIPLSLGFYYPAWVRERRRYTVQNHRLGDAYFTFTTPVGPFYGSYLLGGLILLGITSIGGAYLAMMFTLKGGPNLSFVWMLPYLATYGFGLFLSRHFVYARMFNHLWNHTSLDRHRFVATMEIGPWLKLQLGNLGAILISGGLLYPWATMRTHRFTASCLSLQLEGDVEKIERLGINQGHAVGDSAAEFIGIDFGL